MSKNWKAALFVGGAWLALTATPAVAQDNEAAESDVASTDNDRAIVVTAQRREQSIQEIPFTVNAVDAEVLANAGVTDVFALQTQVPGLDIRTTNPPSAGGAFSIRGLGSV